MGNKCCRSMKAKYFSHLETQITENSEFYDDDEVIITKQDISKMKKASLHSFSLVDLEIQNSKNDLADSHSLEYLKTKRDYIDSKPNTKKPLQIKVILKYFQFNKFFKIKLNFI